MRYLQVTIVALSVAFLVGKTSTEHPQIEFERCVGQVNVIACDPDIRPQFVLRNTTAGIIRSSANNGGNISCSWTLFAPSNQVIEFDFLNITASNSSDFHLTFYEGFNSSNSVLASFPGPPQYVFESNGSRVHIEFNAVNLRPGDGFKINFQHVQVQVNCPKSLNSCRNRHSCFTNAERCNGKFECDDGTDEEECETAIAERECGRPKIPPVLGNFRILHIFGGRDAIPGSWPWMVSVRFRGEIHNCGAVLIRPDWVLSAAHCFDPRIPSDLWELHFGRYHNIFRQPQNEAIRYIKRLILHPNYMTVDDYPTNDTALIQLNAPVPEMDTISPICLVNVDTETEDDQNSHVTGFGITQGTGFDCTLKQASIPIINASDCRAWHENVTIDDSVICAGYKEGGHDSCSRDSGGPLVIFNSEAERWELIGIVSAGGKFCGQRKNPGIYTNVSYHLNWIRDVIRNYTEQHENVV